MNAARRSLKRRDWPKGLREPRPGYFVWEPPGGSITINGQRRTCLTIGAVSFDEARDQAIAANAYVAARKPSLAQRMAGSTDKSVAELIATMPAPANKNTAKSARSLDKIIGKAIGAKLCTTVTTADCAKLLRELAADGRARTAQAVRSRMLALFAHGQTEGVMQSNPATPTKPPAVEVQRARLSLEQFRAIYAAAPQVNEWLQQAMAIALVTGCDRSTVAGMTRQQIADGHLTIWRQKTRKTNAPVQIPLALRLDALGWTLEDVLRRRSAVLSKWVVHHVSPWGNAPAGSQVFPDRISKAFTAARVLAGIADQIDGKGAPTFHEIRSLAKRLYAAQGGVDTKALLGHSTDEMAELYLDERDGLPPPAIKVQIG